jgi:S1-C subfamily serine protease
MSRSTAFLGFGILSLLVCTFLSAAAPPVVVKEVKPPQIKVLVARPVFQPYEKTAKAASPTVALVRKYKQSVVCIWSGSQDKSRGTGFLVDARGYVITARHTLGVSTDLRVRLLGYPKSFEAEIIAEQRSSDLALLKIDLPGDYNAPPLTFRGEDAEQGEDVVLIGTQLGKTWTVTKGVVSQLSVQAEIDNENMRLLCADAPINHGNSGGPLFDMDGNVVGVALGMHTHGFGNAGVYQTHDVARLFLKKNLPRED